MDRFDEREEAARVLLSSEVARLLGLPQRRVEAFAQRPGMRLMVVSGVRLWRYRDVAQVATSTGRVPPTMAEYEAQFATRLGNAGRA